MTLSDILLDIHAMREDLLVFERKYGVPSELFYEAYVQGEEPAEISWVHDWEQWAGSYELLQARLEAYRQAIKQLVSSATVTGFSQLVERTARHEPTSLAI